MGVLLGAEREVRLGAEREVHLEAEKEALYSRTKTSQGVLR